VIVHETDGLHERVADRGSDKSEAPPLKIPAERVGLDCARGKVFEGPPPTDDRRAANEAPHIGVEAAELLLDLEKRRGVVDRAGDFEPVAHDVGISHQALDPGRRKSSHRTRIESGEGLSVSLSFLENRLPAQSGLCSFEDEKLEENVVIVDRNAPFVVVVVDAQRRLRPRTAPAGSLRRRR